jgi:hypothetical protein
MADVFEGRMADPLIQGAPSMAQLKAILRIKVTV